MGMYFYYRNRFETRSEKRLKKIHIFVSNTVGVWRSKLHTPQPKITRRRGEGGGVPEDIV